MDDEVAANPNLVCLFQVASGQHGYFTAAQARACGFQRSLLTYHTRTGKFIRVHRGVYRLRDYPSSHREEVAAAWLAVGKERAVVSHESALDLHGLSDVIPRSIHLTVPRAARHLTQLPGVMIHTTVRPLVPPDVIQREGIRVTSVPRTILDAAETGTAPDQIIRAIHEASEQGLLTKEQLIAASKSRSHRVIRLVDDAFEGIAL